MDKNAIKKYAIWAREELIRRVSTKAEQYGITKENIMDAQADSVHGRLLSGTELIVSNLFSLVLSSCICYN